MNRQTDSLAAEHNAHSARDADEIARIAATAAALLELAIQESLAPVERLGRSFARIAAAPDATETVRSELAVCIESLQFHDRLSQQLTHVRDLLAGAATASPADPLTWPHLREHLRAHFTTASHRMLFNLLMSGEGTGTAVRLHAEEGSVELF